MKTSETITYISIAVIAVSLFFIGTELTGFATINDTGVVNVTIETAGTLNFTAAILDFGAGHVEVVGTPAVLDSFAGNKSGGTWEEEDGELILQNIGNVNVTLNLSASENAGDFIGEGAIFEAKVTDNETGSCTGIQAFEEFVSITTTEQVACGTSFGYDENDSIKIDFRLTIPSDAVGEKTVTITAEGEYAE